MTLKKTDSDAALFLNSVRNHAGQDGVTAVQKMKGGVMTALPRFADDGRSWIVKAIGLEAAKKVCADMRVLDADNRVVGRLKLLVPLGDQGVLHTARVKMLDEAERLLSSGLSVQRTALEVRVGVRTIWRLKKKLVQEGKLLAPRAAP